MLSEERKLKMLERFEKFKSTCDHHPALYWSGLLAYHLTGIQRISAQDLSSFVEQIDWLREQYDAAIMSSLNEVSK